MKQRIIMLALLLAACLARAADYEAAALQILSGKPIGPGNCFVDNNGDGVRDGTTGGVSLEDVRAITNRADVVALVAKPAGQLALEKRLTNNVQIVFGVLPPYTPGQYASLVQAGQQAQEQSVATMNAAADWGAAKAAVIKSARIQNILALIRQLQEGYAPWSLYAGDIGK